MPGAPRGHPPFFTARRCWLMVLTSLLLGVLTVACTCAIFLRGEASPLNVSSSAEIDGRRLNYLQAYERTPYGAIRIWSETGDDLRAFPEAKLRPAMQESVNRVFNSELGDIVSPPAWLTWPPPVDQPITDWGEAGIGWPWCAVRARRFTIHGGPVTPLPGVREFVPHWPGLAADLLLAAAAWCTLITSVSWSARTIRRTIRTKKRRCLECGYARDGLTTESPCPECGAAP